MTESFVEALLEERRGYVVRGLTARVAQVDAELARFGVKVGKEVEAPPGEGDRAEVAAKRGGRSRG